MADSLGPAVFDLISGLRNDAIGVGRRPARARCPARPDPQRQARRQGRRTGRAACSLARRLGRQLVRSRTGELLPVSRRLNSWNSVGPPQHPAPELAAAEQPQPGTERQYRRLMDTLARPAREQAVAGAVTPAMPAVAGRGLVHPSILSEGRGPSVSEGREPSMMGACERPLGVSVGGHREPVSRRVCGRPGNRPCTTRQ